MIRDPEPEGGHVAHDALHRPIDLQPLEEQALEYPRGIARLPAPVMPLDLRPYAEFPVNSVGGDVGCDSAFVEPELCVEPPVPMARVFGVEVLNIPRMLAFPSSPGSVRPSWPSICRSRSGSLIILHSLLAGNLPDGAVTISYSDRTKARIPSGYYPLSRCAIFCPLEFRPGTYNLVYELFLAYGFEFPVSSGSAFFLTARPFFREGLAPYGRE